MTDPTLTISIDRTGLSLGALAFAGSGTSGLGIVNYQPPSLQMRGVYMPDSDSIHGSEMVAASYQQAVLGFDWVADQETTETNVQAKFAEVAAAIGQFSYAITTQVSGAPAQVWAANAGTITKAARTYSDLTYRNPVYSVTIPVYPIAGS